MGSLYASFLQSPSSSALAADATLNYITTTTSISEPAAILKHLEAQAKQLVKDDKILNIVEGQGSVCIESETTLQFTSGGGAFLPGIDDNLLDEKTVTLILVHIVTFDSEQKIKQIRLYWEQGTLLKQIEAIGRTGRNWPIRDGKALVEAVKGSLKASGQQANGKAATIRTAAEVHSRDHQRAESIAATRDPHASLSLFSPRDPNQDTNRSYDGPALAPRASAKPAPRNYGDLFVGDDESPSASQQRSSSPSKVEGRVLKANAGKKFSAPRLFDENVPLEAPQSPERKKTYGQKYEHFAFGDGEDATQRPASKGGKKPNHFSFEEFSTPPKAAEDKGRPDQERHWGAGVDEDYPAASPERREVVHRPRPDAESHFEMTDNTPTHPAQKNRPTTNVDNARRGQDFGSHYEISDKQAPDSKQRNRKDTQRSDLETHWNFGSPIENKKIYKTAGDGMGGRSIIEPGVQQKKIYKTAGDGMGGRGARAWGIGDESGGEEEPSVRPSARSRRQAAGGADF